MQLEYEVQIASNKYMEYESIINQMEHDMVQIQKIWNKGQNQQSKIDTQNIATSPILQENKHASVQAIVDLNPKEIQTDPYICCLNKKETNEVEVQTICFEENDSENLKFKERTKESTKSNTEMEKEKSTYFKESIECKGKAEKEKEATKENNDQEISLLREQLNEALKLVSERSSTLIKCELQITECQAKIDSLNKIIKNKDVELVQKKKLLDEYKLSSELQVSDTQCSDLALKSSVNSLQKLLSQKEETIARYQNLLKEDRDEHSKAAARLQEEIKNLHIRILSMENETQRGQHEKHDNSKNNVKEEPEKLIDKTLEITSKTEDIKNIAMRVEEIARLQEKVSTLEADLNITKELSDRWHRLAEERLKHMDRMRER